MVAMDRQRLFLWTALACLVYAVLPATEAAETDADKVEEALKMIEHLSETRQGLNSLKKIVNDIDNDLHSSHKLDDISRKRKGLDILQRILNEMEADLVYEQKRTCQFNLGGHCATESAAYVADHWHYLNSPLSPGRKRRDTRVYKNLISGKLLQ